jgi:integrase
MSISAEDTIKFLSYLKPLYRDLALIQYLTCSRISETAGLQLNRIEFKRSKLTIMETCRWDMSSKLFVELNQHPKNKEPRPMYITPIIKEALERRLEHREDNCNFVFHVEGKPLNYGTIQVNYRGALRKAGLPHTGTHMLRHGMAKLARRVGGGLDAVIAMSGHKDFKLADHYSKLDQDFQKEIAIKVENHFKQHLQTDEVTQQEKPQEAMPESFENVLSFAQFAKKRASQ